MLLNTIPQREIYNSVKTIRSQNTPYLSFIATERFVSFSYNKISHIPYS